MTPGEIAAARAIGAMRARVNVMTAGFASTVSQADRERTAAQVARWGVAALAVLANTRKAGAGPDFVVGRPGAVAQAVEDDGRTLILPLPADAPKVYAVGNETGGTTLMLAEEY